MNHLIYVILILPNKKIVIILLFAQILETKNGISTNV